MTLIFVKVFVKSEFYKFKAVILRHWHIKRLFSFKSENKRLKLYFVRYLKRKPAEFQRVLIIFILGINL